MPARGSHNWNSPVVPDMGTNYSEIRGPTITPAVARVRPTRNVHPVVRNNSVPVDTKDSIRPRIKIPRGDRIHPVWHPVYRVPVITVFSFVLSSEFDWFAKSVTCRTRLPVDCVV